MMNSTYVVEIQWDPTGGDSNMFLASWFTWWFQNSTPRIEDMIPFFLKNISFKWEEKQIWLIDFN